MKSHRQHRALARLGIAVAVAGVALYVASSTLGASGGAIRVFVTPSLKGNGGTILITGAIGDHGRTTRANPAGQPDPHGTFSLAELRQGTLVLNTGPLRKALGSAMENARVNTATCSVGGSATAVVPIVGGTGLYAGDTGTVHTRAWFGEVGPMYANGPKKGKCNENANPLAQWAAIVGSGTVG